MKFVAAVSRKETGAYKPGQNGTLEFVGPGEPVTFTGQNNWSGLAKLTLMPTTEQKLKLGYVALEQCILDRRGRIHRYQQALHANGDRRLFLEAEQSVDRSRTPRPGGHRPTIISTGPHARAYGYFDLQYGLTSFGGSLSNTSRFDIPLFNVAWTNGVEYFKDQTKTGVITDQTNPSDAEWFSGPTPAGMRDIASAFSEIKFKQGEWLELIAGGRYDRYSLKGSGNFINNRDDGVRRVEMHAALLGRQIGRAFLAQVHRGGDSRRRASRSTAPTRKASGRRRSWRRCSTDGTSATA